MTSNATLDFSHLLQVGDGMLIIDPTSADFIDDDENDIPGGSGGGLRGNLSKKKKIGGKGGRGGRKDGEKGGRKKGTEGDLKGGKKGTWHQ